VTTQVLNLDSEARFYFCFLFRIIRLRIFYYGSWETSITLTAQDPMLGFEPARWLCGLAQSASGESHRTPLAGVL
jgi:hypothetical protein